MKKLLCLSVLLLFPAISHAQSHGTGSNNMNSPTASASGGGGGSLGGGSGTITPAIDRHHEANHGMNAYQNPGPFEPTEILPWEQAISLAQPKPEKSLATIARESREQAAKETVPARATLTN